MIICENTVCVRFQNETETAKYKSSGLDQAFMRAAFRDAAFLEHRDAQVGVSGSRP